METFRDTSLFPHECRDCKKRFPSLEKLLNHDKYKYRTCLSFQCEFCTSKFFTALKLSNHVSEKHQAANVSDSEQEVPHCSNTIGMDIEDVEDETVDFVPFPVENLDISNVEFSLVD